MEFRFVCSNGGRLSNILKKDLAMSTGMINRLKYSGYIMVSGKPCHVDYQVSAGEEISFVLDEESPEFPPESGELKVLFEDDYFLVIDKPAGLLIHPTRNRNTGTLANYVLGYYDVTGQESGFHPVSRLDRDTFGVVLIAKNSYVHSLMHNQLTNGEFDKVYEALVYGNPIQSCGRIDAPIARKPYPSLLREVSELGKRSITDYEVLETCGGLSRIRLVPITGRTHQLRLHCMHAGFPIIGDPHYNSSESSEFSILLGVSTQLLCASKIEFRHPVTREIVIVESTLAGSIKSNLRKI